MTQTILWHLVEIILVFHLVSADRLTQSGLESSYPFPKLSPHGQLSSSGSELKFWRCELLFSVHFEKMRMVSPGSRRPLKFSGIYTNQNILRACVLTFVSENIFLFMIGGYSDLLSLIELPVPLTQSILGSPGKHFHLDMREGAGLPQKTLLGTDLITFELPLVIRIKALCTDQTGTVMDPQCEEVNLHAQLWQKVGHK